MDSQKLEAFLQVAEFGSLAKATKLLHVSQPALTRRLRSLEHEVDAVLFTRGRFGMKLTEAGRVFVPFANRALLLLRDGMTMAHDFHTGSAGEITIGTTPSVAPYWLPPVLTRFHAENPDVVVHIEIGNRHQVQEMVVQGAVHLGIASADTLHTEIQAVPLYEDEHVAVVGPRNRLARRRMIPMSALSSSDLIVAWKSQELPFLPDVLLRDSATSLLVKVNSESVETVKRLVESGFGVAILPRTTVAAEVARRSLCAVRISGRAERRWVVLAMRRRDSPNPTIDAFLATGRKMPRRAYL
jgi:DNA-binding transcriptional LysR family regulator